jgi:hypothetical protein
LGHDALPGPSWEDPGNDIAVDSKVWQAWPLQCKLNFAVATLAGAPALI